MRTNPLIIGAVALSAMAAQAGEICPRKWVCSSPPAAVTTIPVWVDVLPWVRIKDLDKLVLCLIPHSAHTYKGCIDVTFEARGTLDVTAEIVPNGLVPGKYTCFLSSSSITAPGGTLTLCARLETEAPLPPPDHLCVGMVVFRISARP